MKTSQNFIINGNFDLWQKGISFSIPVDAKYSNLGGSTLTAQTENLADRWYAIDTQLRTAGSTGQIQLYKEEFTGAVVNKPGNAKNYLTVLNQITAVTGGYLYIENKQYDATSYMGMLLNLSFFAKSTSGVTGITLTCYARQALEPNKTENKIEVNKIIEITPQWKLYTTLFQLPLINVSGLSADHYFGVGFKLNKESSISLSSVVLEPYGKDIVGLSITDPIEEKEQQNRYYFNTFKSLSTESGFENGNDLNSISFIVNPNYSVNYKFPRPMHKVPTITFYSPENLNLNTAYNKTAGKDMKKTSGTFGWNQAPRFCPTGTTPLSATGNTYGVQLNVVAGAVIFDEILVHMIADADIKTAPYDRGLET